MYYSFRLSFKYFVLSNRLTESRYPYLPRYLNSVKERGRYKYLDSVNELLTCSAIDSAQSDTGRRNLFGFQRLADEMYVLEVASNNNSGNQILLYHEILLTGRNRSDRTILSFLDIALVDLCVKKKKNYPRFCSSLSTIFHGWAKMKETLRTCGYSSSG